jgi:hypothetical protein
MLYKILCLLVILDISLCESSLPKALNLFVSTGLAAGSFDNSTTCADSFSFSEDNSSFV